MWFLSFFSRVDPKRVGLGVLIVVVFALSAAVKIQNDQLATATLVYKYPRVVVKQRVERIVGPVRIVTVMVERANGEKESTITEDRGSVLETTSRDSVSQPVSLATTLTPPRTDRYLLGLGLDNWTPNDLHAYRVYAGYSFKNRLDVLYGIGYRDSLDQQVVAIVRF